MRTNQNHPTMSGSILIVNILSTQVITRTDKCRKETQIGEMIMNYRILYWVDGIKSPRELEKQTMP